MSLVAIPVLNMIKSKISASVKFLIFGQLHVSKILNSKHTAEIVLG